MKKRTNAGRAPRQRFKRKGKIMKKIIYTPHAPAPIGPYSQGIMVDGTFYCSGQIAINPENGKIDGTTIEEQTYRVMMNLSNVLAAAGLGFADVVKTTCFLANMEDFSKFNEIYAKYFVSNPARSCVAAKSLPKGVLVEVELIATE